MRKNYIIYTLCCAIFLGVTLPTRAQIVVSDNQTAQALVDALVGEGVTTSNAVLNCATEANGLFSGPNNLGIDSGIILTSGNAVEVEGPLVGSGADDGDFIPYPPGDPDLDNVLDGISSHDACVLEFDFVPAGDTVKFNYVFGSTEYQIFSCSSYNDVFAFFISGPNYTTPLNIAVVPGTDIPVCVNSTTGVPALNGDPPDSDCTDMGTGSPFDQYYIDNMEDGTSVNFGGFTTVFTAVAQTIPCETYHLKLAIGDGQDASLDSGVFLEAGSLSSPSISSVSESGQGVETPYTSTVRGCPPAKLIVSRTGSTSLPLTVHYNILGNAVNGVDYGLIPDSVTIPVGQSSAAVNVVGLLPGNGGTVQAIFEILSPYICGGTSGNVVSVDTITIFDSLHVNIIQPDTSICIGAALNLEVEGESYYSYQWTPASGVSNPTGTNVTVSPTQTTTYVIQARIDGIVCPPATDYIVVQAEPGPDVELGPDLYLCTYDTAYLYAAVTPTTSDYTYQWSPGIHLNDSTSDVAIYFNDYPETERIIVSAATALGCKGVDTITLYVSSGDFLQNVVTDTGVCPGTVFQFNISGADQYRWMPPIDMSDSSLANPTMNPLASQQYTLYGYRRGCVDSAIVNLEVYPQANINLPDSVAIYPGESYQLDAQGNSLYYQWFPSSGLNNPNIANPIATPDVRTRYFITGKTENDCEVTDSIDVLVFTESLLDLPNAFTATNGDFKIIKRGEATLKNFTIVNRWGQQVFETANIDQGWDGTFNDKAQPMGVYVYRVEAVTKSGKSFIKEGNVTLLR